MLQSTIDLADALLSGADSHDARSPLRMNVSDDGSVTLDAEVSAQVQEALCEMHIILQRYPGEYLAPQARRAFTEVRLGLAPTPSFEALLALFVLVLGNDPTTTFCPERTGRMGVLGSAHGYAHWVDGARRGLNLDEPQAIALAHSFAHGDVSPKKDAHIDAVKAHVEEKILPAILDLVLRAQAAGTTAIVVGLGRWPDQLFHRHFEHTALIGLPGYTMSRDSHTGEFVTLLRILHTNVRFIYAGYAHPGSSGSGEDEANAPYYGTLLNRAMRGDYSETVDIECPSALRERLEWLPESLLAPPHDVRPRASSI